MDSSSPEARDAPAPPLESERFEESVERLVAFGVWRTRAQKVVHEWALAPEQVERACAALADEIKGGADFENPPALLLSRLRSGWEPHEIVREEPPEVDGLEDDDDPFMDDWKIEEPVKPPFPPIADAYGREHEAEKWFDWLKGELQMQLPRETFDTWLRWAELSDYQPPSGAEPGCLVIGLSNQYAYEWVKHRLHTVIQQLVDRLIGDTTLVVEYVCLGEAVL
jgi:hypothetical protein